MRFLLDQSVEARIGTFLRDNGHNVKRIASDFPAGLPDEQVLEIARTEQRILLINDRDFGELIFRQKLSHVGIIYFRFPLDATGQQKIVALARLLNTHKDQLHEFIVVTPAGVRKGKLR